MTVLTAGIIRGLTEACDEGLRPFRENFPDGCPDAEHLLEWALTDLDRHGMELFGQVWCVQTEYHYFPDWIGERFAEFRKQFGVEIDPVTTYALRPRQGPNSIYYAVAGLPIDYLYAEQPCRDAYLRILCDIAFGFLRDRPEHVRAINANLPDA